MLGFGKRRQYVINPKFQRGLVARVFAVLMLNNIAVYFSINYFFSRFYQKASELNIPVENSLVQFVGEQQSVFTYLIVVAMSCTFLIVMFFGIFYSHRIAGPIHKMTMELDKMGAEKKLESVSIRKGDYFQELVDAFNRMIEKIK